ncbi:hypothetical protein CFOL_v3_33427 [Cephalotus follicularis]|uniref:Uncharacterized protein n=1 Tax=Cephalotus follicularis TaxID=3775 RepID=A0A1Q3DCN4_CEPFO|nr:hypothetical protein CFOL_v3_33427 [Cephalotus follicularis]
MEVIVSTRYLLMKFPTRFGVREARGDQQAARQCYKTAITDHGKDKVLPIANVEFRGDVEPERPQPVEDGVQVPLEAGNSERVFQVRSQLGEVEKEELITFLQNNKYVFAWSAEEVPGISPSVMVHKLSVDTTRKRAFPDRQSGQENLKSGRPKVSPTAFPTALTATYNRVADYNPTVSPTAFIVCRSLKRSAGKTVAIDRCQDFNFA